MADHSRKKLDLTGQRFGKLTALGPAENIGSRTAWWCRCDCGRETIVATRRLRNSRRTSCGCGADGRKKIPGQDGRASLTYVDGTCVEMIRAGTVRRNNTSGVPGVDWMARKRRWRASICFKGTRHYLGSYQNFDDAVRARREAEDHFFENFLREFAEASPAEASADSNKEEERRLPMVQNEPPGHPDPPFNARGRRGTGQ